MSKRDHFANTRMRKVRALVKSGRLDEAAVMCRKICDRKGVSPDALLLLGDIYRKLGRYEESVMCYQRVISARPDDAEACGEIAHVMMLQGKPEQAMVYYQKAVECRTNDPKLLANYSAMLMGLNRPSEAEPHLRRAIDLDPDLSQLYTSLGSCLSAQGKVRDALDSYEQALRNVDADPVMHSNYLLTRHYIYCSNPEENLDAHLEWVERHVVRKEVFRRQEDHVPDPNKKLRVGYVSPDFRTHSVAYFLDPLFQNHDTNVFDVYCYSDVSVPDVTTRRLRNNVKIWRDTSSLGSSELVRLIRGDGIDLLVDLSGHTAGNRLMAFAEKPAPVQVTWLGYPDTTGLDVMDYRITDLYADPVGSEKYYSEHLVRLEGCFLCYEPPGEAPAVVVNPAAASRSLTFGSFNNRAKINCDVIKLWADILRKLPHARLLIKNPGLTDKAVCADLRGQFIRRGIEAERVVLKGVSATTVEHLEEYHNIDIALDTFPYNGTTTTCEALWMGVPVLTLSGGCHAGRVGRSLLSAVGLDDWVAETEKEYVDHAVAYANSPDALVRLRASMRQRMADSVLCDGKIFTAKLESVYRSMWVDWCRQF